MSSPSPYNQKIIEQFRTRGGQTDHSMPLLLLTTIGAKSGQRRTTPLAYSRDGGRLVIIASKGGAPTNPDWYHNILANPVVTVELGKDRFQARATVTDEPERERLYNQHAALMPGFKEYLQKTTRKIPVIVLERIA